MKQQIRIAPPNSLILVMDESAADIPETMGDRGIASTSTCVAIATLCELDGETLIMLTDDADVVGGGLSLAFDDVLKTPARNLSVRTCLDQPLLTTDVVAEQTRVMIWVNRSSEPSEIAIVFSGMLGDANPPSTSKRK